MYREKIKISKGAEYNITGQKPNTCGCSSKRREIKMKKTPYAIRVYSRELYKIKNNLNFKILKKYVFF